MLKLAPKPVPLLAPKLVQKLLLRPLTLLLLRLKKRSKLHACFARKGQALKTPGSLVLPGVFASEAPMRFWLAAAAVMFSSPMFTLD